ncbi:HHL288Wp [Eremothecium sinecaudum]|uniref:HHL288Wp n=1 Tax=Eremothecium sinecaudum TaxID=45286 RepID=A0A0X8HVZ2_9SACH|nr:HHL288Wp [Eremothecium sinecaudum]AMD22482.1 HHL288Wp [Eremothecium sinecaudum]
MNQQAVFPLERLPEELIQEIFSHLPQPDRLRLCHINKKCYQIAMHLIYNRIYLNDSNVVKSDFMDLAINWTFLSIPSFMQEEESRKVANEKLKKLIGTLQVNPQTLNMIQWVRINWDLNPVLQKTILTLLCNKSASLQRLENVTDPDCNDIVAFGQMSHKNLTSFDMAPPNSLPERPVSPNYIPDLSRYLKQRISCKLSHMTLFMDPVQLFNYIHPLTHKLQIRDLKLHWRREFYPPSEFKNKRKTPLTKLSEIFDIRALKVLTIISWNESLSPRELDMLKEFEEFFNIEDLSLISVAQHTMVLVDLFNKLVNLKRLKMDFLENYIPQATKPDIFLSILISCKKLQFLDIRFEGLDSPIMAIENDRYRTERKCHCARCVKTHDEIICKKIFHYLDDLKMIDIEELTAKDIFAMMRYQSLLPYSKACDSYPSVRTQPMNMDQFVQIMNESILNYRKLRGQLAGISPDSELPLDHEEGLSLLPHDPFTSQDVIDCFHTLIHHYKRTYITLLSEFPELRFLMLNDVPTVIIEENSERIPHPVFFHDGYVSNLHGWTKKLKKRNNDDNKDLSTVNRQVTLC